MVVPATLQCRVSHVLVIDDHTFTDFLLVQRYITECIQTSSKALVVMSFDLPGC